ncbi:hypothetical protein JOQ06_006651 [Pogonophryne albipinna]|uniref:Beta-catenin-like protein 1 N-terminal domain-containing protein n=1 Tax=Pogonophryne albipinna TaxID=1090488 RepID=A0AAD6AZA4_9TELE|nr:hypothetical protein JOQ06_006651 [Pogonophryne albipinna]
MVRRGEILDDGIEDDFYIRRLDAGLFVLQLICYIMVEISNSGIAQLQQRVQQILNLRGGSVKVVRHIMRAESAPGNDSPCTHGRSVPVTDLINGHAQYCIVPCRVAVVTGGESTSMPKKKAAVDSFTYASISGPALHFSNFPSQALLRIPNDGLTSGVRVDHRHTGEKSHLFHLSVSTSLGLVCNPCLGGRETPPGLRQLQHSLSNIRLTNQPSDEYAESIGDGKSEEFKEAERKRIMDLVENF